MLIKRRIVVVEDDGTVGDLIQDFAMDLGFECRVFHTPAEAIDEIREDDIVISDVQFIGDKFGGVDFYRRLREWLPFSPEAFTFVFMTAYSREIAENKVADLGVDLPVLYKPFDMGELKQFLVS